MNRSDEEKERERERAKLNRELNKNGKKKLLTKKQLVSRSETNRKYYQKRKAMLEVQRVDVVERR